MTGDHHERTREARRLTHVLRECEPLMSAPARCVIATTYEYLEWGWPVTQECLARLRWVAGKYLRVR